jgi:uncharacterized protein YeaO (DUF488 family)
LTKWRLEQARALLQQNHLSLESIAESVGYGSEAALSRAFKRLFGVSPRPARSRPSEPPQTSHLPLRAKQVYEPPAPEDGKRVLIDGLWPRGLAKEKAHIDLWLKEIAPSAALRRWFAHDPAKWPTFRSRYHQELRKNQSVVKNLETTLRDGPVTLLYAARGRYHNAAALIDYLSSRRSPVRRRG